VLVCGPLLAGLQTQVLGRSTLRQNGICEGEICEDGIAFVATQDYNPAMRRPIYCLLLLSGGLISGVAGQDKIGPRRLEVTPKLRSTLQALKDSRASRTTLSHRLADEIMSMADSEHKPERTTVASFAEELTSALIGRDLTNSQVMMLERSIDEVLANSGATFTSASRLREALASLGVDASRLQIIVKRFIAIGEEVRGPDDLKLSVQ
jgi:hypothetical protein